MSEILDREPGETIDDYAQRMIDLVDFIGGIIMLEAGLGVDCEDVIADARWLIALPDDTRREIFELQQQIDRVVRRMTSETRLKRILYFATEMSQ